MAKTFSVPSSPSKSAVTISTFSGVDFTNSPAACSASQSPNSENMIRDVPGKIRKRMGYEVIGEYDGKINGFHYLYGLDEGLIHAGTKLYKGDIVVYNDMNNAISKSWQFDDKLFIVDGKTFLMYDGTTVSKVTDNAYVPTVTIAKAPTGGGTSYEPINLLSRGFTERFLGIADKKKYQLSFNNLDNDTVLVKKMTTDGSFVSLTENTDFTVDRPNGLITFTTAPGASPLAGEDNVYITAYRTVDGYADRINKCTIGIQYGVNAATDRLFLSGNPDYINYDWYSQKDDPTYFPDTGYAVMGTSKSAIMGYSIISSYLATHKDENETDQAIILRDGKLVDSEPSFPITSSLQGNGAIGKYTFEYLETEPLYLTRNGIHAVTTPDSGEKYSQNRSYYLNGRLLAENDLEKAYSCIYNGMYLLALNGAIYCLDGMQKFKEDNEPYSTRQYAGFYCTNIPATILYSHNQRLYFGTSDGNVCRFYNDATAQSSYNDNGNAIHAIWETPDFSGNAFYKKKTFRYMAIRLQTAIATSINIYAQKKGLWSLLKTDESSARFFKFSEFVFSKFSFNTDTTQKVIPLKLRLKKLDKARFKFENNKVNEPFGIFDYALEYIESGNIK